MLRKVYKIEPLQCPFCGGKMKMIAFIIEHPYVNQILRYIDAGAAARAPGDSPPLQEEPLYAS